MSPEQIRFLEMAVNLAAENLQEHHGRPFGAVLIKDGEVIATGVNEILSTMDPTAHCVIYASGQPCPMCLSAMHMTGIKEVYFALSNADGEPYGLSTAKIYEEMQKPLGLQSINIQQHSLTGALDRLYGGWKRKTKT